jgi:hypothetical protein
MSSTQTFKFRYGAFGGLLSVLGLGPAFSRVELDGDTLRVAMGWAFRATVPVSRIIEARPRSGLVGGIGVHGWRGRWLVNGAAAGLVTLTIDPEVRARVVVPVRLRVLSLSLEDPDGVLAALGR